MSHYQTLTEAIYGGYHADTYIDHDSFWELAEEVLTDDEKTIMRLLWYYDGRHTRLTIADAARKIDMPYTYVYGRVNSGMSKMRRGNRRFRRTVPSERRTHPSPQAPEFEYGSTEYGYA